MFRQPVSAIKMLPYANCQYGNINIITLGDLLQAMQGSPAWAGTASVFVVRFWVVFVERASELSLRFRVFLRTLTAASIRITFIAPGRRIILVISTQSTFYSS